MLYLVINTYEPNQAFTNRLLGYFTNLDKLDVEATVIFLAPNYRADRIKQTYHNITVKYLWSEYELRLSLIRYFMYYFHIIRLILSFNRGDIVYTYGINNATRIFTMIKGIKTCAEITEHPSIVDGGKLWTLSEEVKYKVAAKLDKLFVISTPLKRLFVESGVHEDRIQIVNMFVDAERFKNLTKQQVSDKYIAYCGNASNNKDGVNKLLKAFKLVIQKHPDYKLYIIGQAPSKVVGDSNYALAQNLGILENVVFTGSVPSDKVPQLLKDAVILALNRPDSLQAEYGFPTKLGEYLLTQNPVVITKVGDIPKFLVDGKTALLVSPDNDEEFAVKLIWLIENSHHASQIGLAGSILAFKEFNAEIETKKLSDSILGCLDS